MIYPVSNSPNEIEYAYVNHEKKTIKELMTTLDEIKEQVTKKLTITYDNQPINTQEELIDKILKETSKGKALEIGYGTNTKIMEYLTKKGYKVTGIDIYKLPDQHEELMYSKPQLSNHLKAKKGEVIELGMINNIKRVAAHYLDYQDKELNLIYFWGSWSSHSYNITIDQTAKEYFYEPPFEVKARNNEERLAEITYKIKKATIKKTREMLNKNGTLAIINPKYAKHGTGYYYTLNELIDNTELLPLISENGFNKTTIIGDNNRIKALITTLS